MLLWSTYTWPKYPWIFQWCKSRGRHLIRISVAYPQQGSTREWQMNLPDCWQLCFPKALPWPCLSHELVAWQTCITWSQPVVPAEVLYSLLCQEGSSSLTQYSELCREVINEHLSVMPLPRNSLASNHRDYWWFKPTAQTIKLPDCLPKWGQRTTKHPRIAG